MIVNFRELNAFSLARDSKLKKIAFETARSSLYAFSFLRLTLLCDLVKARIRKTMPFHQCELFNELRRPFLISFKLPLYWSINSRHIKISFFKAYIDSKFYVCILHYHRCCYSLATYTRECRRGTAMELCTGINILYSSSLFYVLSHGCLFY